MFSVHYSCMQVCSLLTDFGRRAAAGLAAAACWEPPAWHTPAVAPNSQALSLQRMAAVQWPAAAQAPSPWMARLQPMQQQACQASHMQVVLRRCDMQADRQPHKPLPLAGSLLDHQLMLA